MALAAGVYGNHENHSGMALPDGTSRGHDIANVPEMTRTSEMTNRQARTKQGPGFLPPRPQRRRDLPGRHPSGPDGNGA
jgi:hypothetical protein